MSERTPYKSTLELQDFYIGKKVQYVSARWGNAYNNPLWGIGTVKSIKRDGLPIGVEWERGGQNYYDYCDLNGVGEVIFKETKVIAL